MPHIVKLRSGHTWCEIAPSIGCAVTAFCTEEAGRVLHWMRPYLAHGPASVSAAASGCFPLVPYSGRIESGVLTWRGRDYALPTGLLGDAHALHGTGWAYPWETVYAEADRAGFRHVHSGHDWPFPFQSSLDYRLVDDRLSIRIEVRNTGTADMPVGLGLHPVFSGQGLRLRAHAGTVWDITPDKLFAGKSAAEGRWDFSAGAPLADTDLEHGFTGWDGVFDLLWPDRDAFLRVHGTELLRHLVIYTREYGDDQNGFACVEPVSCSVDAFNLAGKGVADTGTVCVSPSEAVSAEVCFEITR